MWAREIFRGSLGERREIIAVIFHVVVRKTEKKESVKCCLTKDPLQHALHH